MNKFRELLRILGKPSIGRQFALQIFVFSSVVTLISTVLQLSIEFKRDMLVIEGTLEQIRKSYANSLAGSLWVTSRKDVQLQLDGAFRLPDMQYLEVRSSEDRIVAAAGAADAQRKLWQEIPLYFEYLAKQVLNGELSTAASLEAAYRRLREGKQEQWLLRQETPLYFEYLGKPVFVGKLIAAASPESAYRHMKDKVVVILISQAVKTFLVSIFILYLFQRLVGRHLINIAQHSQLIEAGSESRLLVLDRKQALGPNQDEMDQMIGAFNNMSLRMSKAYIELQRFAEISAHHLQEPSRRLASYSGRLARQLAGKLDDAEARQSLEYIGQQARRLQNLLRDVERYLAASQARGEVSSLDTRIEVDKILAGMAAQIRAAGAEITLGELPAVRMDAPRLADAFSVTLDNALQFGRDGHPLRIAIAGERLGNRVRFSVSDNGPGIAESYRERVFRVFERLTGKGEGTGIGLAILRSITESTGGRAWIEETPGGGCRVLFDLPAGESA